MLPQDNGKRANDVVLYGERWPPRSTKTAPVESGLKEERANAIDLIDSTSDKTATTMSQSTFAIRRCFSRERKNLNLNRHLGSVSTKVEDFLFLSHYVEILFAAMTLVSVFIIHCIQRLYVTRSKSLRLWWEYLLEMNECAICDKVWKNQI